MSTTKKADNCGAERAFDYRVAELLHKSDRVNLNENGLVEVDDGRDESPLKMTLGQLRSIVRAVEDAKADREATSATTIRSD